MAAAPISHDVSTPSFSEALCYSLKVLKLDPRVSLKPEQRMAIQGVYDGNDVLVWSHTSLDKSLTFQTLPFVMDYKLRLVGTEKSSAVLVISPLVALMVDQVRSLRSRGVKCSMITTSGSAIAKELLGTEASLFTDSLFYCAPEAMVGSSWREALRGKLSTRIVAVVIDEAHCVSEWSRDFRPSLDRLGELRALVPYSTPYMACTAPATQAVRQQVVDSLEMHSCIVVSLSPDRPNIFYAVQHRTEIEGDFLELLTSLQTSTSNAARVIVYCKSMNTCADLYAHFHYELGNASYYPVGAPQLSHNRLFGMFHSHTPQHNKDVILKSFQAPDGVVRVVFATDAFAAVGIDFQGVNKIIHYGAPMTLEDYFQESGRGGLQIGDSTPSIVYWKPADCLVKKEPSTPRHYANIAVRKYLENTSECRWKMLLDYFDSSCAKPGRNPSRCCDVCSKSL